MEPTVDKRVFDVTDDSGFLALIDSDGYEGFVDENWDFPQLLTHFQSQMQQHRLLIWGTGAEAVWHVEVQFEPVQEQGFQEQIGSIDVSEGWLLLTNYESLTMAAQFEDVKLPEPHQQKQLLQVGPGVYRCRIIQLQDHAYNPEREQGINEKRVGADYIIELLRHEELAPPWQSIPWATV